MVRILTKDYTELDLTKGFEFQIEMENPMLDEEHIPSAFSTQISFPPSPVNRKVFGYTPAMFLAPNVKRLEASAWIGGVPFVTGTLVYDGIEDGCLMYTFTEKMVELEGKIWEKSILEFDTGSIPSTLSKFSTPWLGKTRQRVAVDVNLTPVELHNFRLYRPVYFRGRKWIVAKLSVTVAAGSDRVSTRGEFIEI